MCFVGSNPAYDHRNKSITCWIMLDYQARERRFPRSLSSVSTLGMVTTDRHETV
jgi:hypothetical protein